MGSPPFCRPECLVSTDCPQSQACSNQRCFDPCLGTCASTAKCRVVNHNPICACPPGQTGNPFVQCIDEKPHDEIYNKDPCEPSPCGLYSQCRSVNDQASCSCLPNMIGTPPNCRPECMTNSDCSSVLSCKNQKCIDPCKNACGRNAICKVISHTPMCNCLDGYIGDPFSECLLKQQDQPIENTSPCAGDPCGVNAICREQNGVGSCICKDDFTGNPYEVCRPQCVVDSDCLPSLSCVNNKCKNTCEGTCGANAVCQMINHNPICSCIHGYSGDPYRYCSLHRDERKENILHYRHQNS